MSCDRVADGRIVPLATGLQQPSTIASIAGLRKEYGGGCLKLWPNNQSGSSYDRQHHRQSPPISRWRKRGADAEAIGRSRGGRSTKIHAAVDGCGRPIALRITPGQRGDAPVAVPLLTLLPASRLCAADTAYDSDTLRDFLTARGTQPVIPNNPTRKRMQPSTPLPTSAGILLNAPSAA